MITRQPKCEASNEAANALSSGTTYRLERAYRKMADPTFDTYGPKDRYRILRANRRARRPPSLKSAAKGHGKPVVVSYLSR